MQICGRYGKWWGINRCGEADLKAQWDKIIAEGEANRQAAYAAAG